MTREPRYEKVKRLSTFSQEGLSCRHIMRAKRQRSRKGCLGMKKTGKTCSSGFPAIGRSRRSSKEPFDGCANWGTSRICCEPCWCMLRVDTVFASWGYGPRWWALARYRSERGASAWSVLKPGSGGCWVRFSARSSRQVGCPLEWDAFCCWMGVGERRQQEVEKM